MPFFSPRSSKRPSTSVTAFTFVPSTLTTAPISVSFELRSVTEPFSCCAIVGIAVPSISKAAAANVIFLFVCLQYVFLLFVCLLFVFQLFVIPFLCFIIISLFASILRLQSYAPVVNTALHSSLKTLTRKLRMVDRRVKKGLHHYKQVFKINRISRCSKLIA